MEQNHILLAGNDPEAARFIENALKNLNVAVTTVTDGNEAWGLLQTGDFTLLICDTELPNISGWKLMRAVRNSIAELKLIPIIAVTDEQPDKDYSTERRNYDVILQKPPSPENGYEPLSELGKWVERILKV